MLPLTLEKVAENPDLISQKFLSKNGEQYLFRPLLDQDVDILTDFLQSLSALTRDRWIVDDYGLKGAQEMCDAIARYDKLRLVIVEQGESSTSMVALLEFSFAILDEDIERFKNYGIELNEQDYTRFGICVRDDMHRSGVFSASMPIAAEIAKRFGKSSIILWGGVLTDNIPAVKAYEKVGFKKLGKFPDHYEKDRFCFDMVLS